MPRVFRPGAAQASQLRAGAAADAEEQIDQAGIQSVAAVQRDASDEMAFRLALVENMHREDLSHQEKVEALDMLASMAAGQGLRQVAGELGTSPGWVSRRLSMRQDPVIFPALEEGRITFVQANELLSAPAAARQKQFDRVIGTKWRVSFDELRTLVQAARGESRGGVVRRLSRRISLTGIQSCRRMHPNPRVLQVVQDLAVPTAAEEITALGDLVACVQERWEHVRPRRGRGLPRQTTGG
jgi:hypothetical protein